MIELKIPVSEEDIRALHVGDEVGITGVMITARDAAHKYMVENEAHEVKDVLAGGMVYHCGPVVKKVGDEWEFVAAGPTTSKREEVYEADVIERYGLRAVIGKGGMGERTLDACNKFGAVYLHAIGGLAVILAKSVKKVRTVHKLEEFGPPEAMWEIEVDKFPAVVTMDTHGKSIHTDVLEASKARYVELAETL